MNLLTEWLSDLRSRFNDELLVTERPHWRFLYGG